ncbi:MAG TPA: hypothetical protein VM163_11695 [bacterium]|nr:hypothetical protein [bacterium]
MKDEGGRLKYFLLCLAICVLSGIFGGVVALRKAQYAPVDRSVAVALAFALPAWFLLTTAVMLVWKRRGNGTWERAAFFDLLFYAFLPVAAGSLCGLDLVDELSMIRIFTTIAVLKTLATVYFMARTSDSGSGRWPAALFGTVLSLGVVLTIVAISGQREHIRAAIKFGPDVYLTREHYTLSEPVKAGTFARRVRVKTALVHSGGILQDTKIAHLRVTDTTGRRYDFPLRAGVDACEKCYEIPNTRTHIRHTRSHEGECSVEFLAHGQAYMGRNCSATFSFGKRIKPNLVEVFFSLDDPKQGLLRIYLRKILFLDQ